MSLIRARRFWYTHLVPIGMRKRIESLVCGPYPRVFDKRKFIFIHIPKTAGKSIGKMMGIRGACHLTFQEYQSLLGNKIRDYFLFSVVRDPLQRFASAYAYLKHGGNGSKENIGFGKRWLPPTADINDLARQLSQSTEVGQMHTLRPQRDFLTNELGEVNQSILLLNFATLSQDIMRIPGQYRDSSDLQWKNRSASTQSLKAITERSETLLREFYAEDFQLMEETFATQGQG